MTEEKALEIINNKRISNSFTMGCSIDEFINNFIRRYKMMFKETISPDYISVAKKIIEIEKEVY